MMCTRYSGYNGCGCCKNIVKSVSVTVDGDLLVVELPNPTKALINKQQICFCLAQPIPPEATEAETVLIQLGSTKKISLVTTAGNLVHADQLRTRKLYHTTLATDTEALMVCEKELLKTRFVFPNIPVVPVP